MVDPGQPHADVYAPSIPTCGELAIRSLPVAAPEGIAQRVLVGRTILAPLPDATPHLTASFAPRISGEGVID